MLNLSINEQKEIIGGSVTMVIYAPDGSVYETIKVNNKEAGREYVRNAYPAGTRYRFL